MTHQTQLIWKLEHEKELARKALAAADALVEAADLMMPLRYEHGVTTCPTCQNAFAVLGGQIEAYRTSVAQLREATE